MAYRDRLAGSLLGTRQIYLCGAVRDVIHAAIKPEGIVRTTARKDIYIDWFESEDKAREHVREAKNA